MFEKTVTLNSGIQVRQEQVGYYLADFYEGGRRLVVTFESAGLDINRKDPLRNSWCLSLLRALGYSVLGIKSPAVNWYRGPRLLKWFGSEEVADFIKSFDDVAFLGGSMGGFAAITFSRVAPGALVIAHNPQSTMNRLLVPWERRPESKRFNKSGPFFDAAEAAPLARRLYVFYDPFHVVDRKHVARIDGPNVEHLKMPFLGHETPKSLFDLGLFVEVTKTTLDGTLTSERFAKMIRSRRNLPRYFEVGARRLRNSGRRHLSTRCFRKLLRQPPATHGRSGRC